MAEETPQVPNPQGQPEAVPFKPSDTGGAPAVPQAPAPEVQPPAEGGEAPQTPAPDQPAAPVATPEDIERIKQELGEEITKKVTQETAEKLANTLRGETPESKKYDYTEAPWVQQGRNPSYEEVVDWVDGMRAEREDQIVEKVMGKLNAEVASDEEQRKQAQEQLQANQKTIQENWNSEFADMEKANQIPAVKDANNPNDPGLLARNQLYTRINERVLAKQAAGQPILPNDYSAKVTFYEDFNGRLDPARNAPVAGARRGAAAGSGGGVGFNYEDIHGKPWDAILNSQS